MIRRYIIGSLIAALAVYLIATRVDLESSLALLKTVEPGILIECSGIYLLAHMFRALRFRVLLGKDSPGFPVLLAVVSVHNLLNQVMPVRTGESAFPVLVRKVAGVGYSKGISALLLVRVYDLAAFLCILAVFALGYVVGSSGVWYAKGVLLCTATVAVFLVFRYLGALVSVVARGAALRIGSPRLRGVVGQDMFSKVDRLAGAMRETASARNYLSLGGYSVCLWLLTYGMFHVFVGSIDAGASFTDTVMGSSGAVITGLLPINTFGSVGTLEGGWTLGFSAVGVSKEAALASGILMHIFVIMFGLVLSAVGGVYLRLRYGATVSGR